MEAQKPFWQSKKFWMSILAMVVAVVPSLLDMLPPDSKLYGLLAGIVPLLVYINSQGKVDVARTLASTQPPAVTPANPTPQP